MNRSSSHSSSPCENVYKVLCQPADNLQLIPAAAIKLLQLTHSETSVIRDLTKVIKTEPALSAQILKIVNSAVFGFAQPITSIQHATGVLGFARIRNIALKLLFYNKLIKNRTSKCFDLLKFWQHSLFVAALSRELAVCLDHPDPDMLYTVGLIHDIGKIVLENHGIIKYSVFLDSYVHETPSFIKSELDFYGVTHEQVGHVFCRDWLLPDVITAVVTFHHSDVPSDPLFLAHQQEIAIVAFADYLAWLHGMGSFQSSRPQVLPYPVINNIPLNKLDMQSFLDRADQDMRENSQFYGIDFPQINQIRASLVDSSLALGQSLWRTAQNSSEPLPAGGFLSNLTIPHQSLDPDIFIPKTLEAICNYFHLDRVLMLYVPALQRNSLMAKYCWPEAISVSNFEINMTSCSGEFMKCLRTQQGAVIREDSNENHIIFRQLGVSEFLAVPILRNNRLSAVLYADNFLSQMPLSAQMLNEITPITNELSSALLNAKHFELEKSKAKIDALTGLFNKRMIIEYLENSFKEAATLKSLVVGFLDIDHFKKLNDSCGHPTGDMALKIVADVLREIIRSGDFAGRYGGEEFLFALQNSSPSGAFQFAERIRTTIEEKGVVLKHRFNHCPLTVSIGIAHYQPKLKNYQELVAAADKAMYQAKHSGRNKVVVFQD